MLRTSTNERTISRLNARRVVALLQARRRDAAQRLHPRFSATIALLRLHELGLSALWGDIFASVATGDRT